MPAIDWDAFILTEEQLAAQMRHCMAVVDHMLAKPRQSYVPTLAVVARGVPPAEESRALLVLACDQWNDNQGRRQFLRTLGASFYLERREVPLAAVLISEAWQSRQSVADREPRCQPRDDPNRQEIILVAGAVLGNRHRLVNFLPITRDAENTIRPGVWGDLQSSQVASSPLLDEFFGGFLRTAMVANLGSGLN